jgi:hypothetical protein
MTKVVEMYFPPEKHVEQPYNLETTGEVLQKLFSEEEVDPYHVAEAKRIMGIKPEASPFARLAEIYAIGSDEEEKTSPRIDCKVNNIDCKALCDIGAQVSVLSSNFFDEIHDHTIDLVQTTTKLIMGDGRIVKPIGISRNLEVIISGKHIPTDFFIVDVYYDKNDHVILGRPFLMLVNAVLDAGKAKVTINLDGDNHTYNFLTACRIVSPLPLDDEEVASLHFVETFRDPLQRAMNNETNNDLDEELIEATKGLEPQDGSLEEDKFEDIGEIKHEEPQVPEVDLKPLPKGLKYEFLGPDKTYHVIVSDELSPEENDMLLNLLKKHKKVIRYSINDLKGLSLAFCTHRIPMEDQCKPVVDYQRSLTHAMQEVVKKEVIKLLDARIIYPVPHSEWVSPVHCVLKKGGLTVVKNDVRW